MTNAQTQQPTDGTKVVIPCRLSYLAVWEKSGYEAGKEKYNASLIISKQDIASVNKIKAAIFVAFNKGLTAGSFKQNTPNLYYPLRDGDIEKPDDAAYKNCWFISAKSNTQPTVLDMDKNEMLIKTNLYSGCFGLVSVNFYPLPAKHPTKGVGAGLGNIMKTADGDALGGGKSSAEDDFKAYAPVAQSPMNQPAAGFGQGFGNAPTSNVPQPGQQPNYGGFGQHPQQQPAQTGFGQPVNGGFVAPAAAPVQNGFGQPAQGGFGQPAAQQWGPATPGDVAF